jgi:hypothetical protein
MTTSNTVKSLARKHAEIQGSIQQVEASLSILKNTLNAVEISIELFDPDYKTHEINAKRSNNKTVTLSRGEVPKVVGDYIRGCSGEFKASDIFDYLADKKGCIFKASEIKNIKQSIFKALQRLVTQGIIIEVGKTGKGGALLWRVTS